MDKHQDYYDPPETQQLIGHMAEPMDRLDEQLSMLEELLVHVGPWINVLPNGKKLQEQAAKTSQRLGRVTMNMMSADLNRLERTDWTAGSIDRVLHLQLIRRFYVLHLLRCMDRALMHELTRARLVPEALVRRVVTAMRQNQASGYEDIRATYGMEPEAFDFHLDQDVDLVEARTSAYLWLLLSGKFGEQALLKSRSGREWQLARADLHAPGAYPAAIGKAECLSIEYPVLVHCLNDTKLKLTALMAAVACQKQVPPMHLAQYLMHLGRSTKLDEATIAKIITSFELAFKAIGSDHVDKALPKNYFSV